MLTAKEILAIPNDRPDLIFSAPTEVEPEYKTLMRHWHTDVNSDPDAAKVSAHINVLHDQVEIRVKSGKWLTPTKYELKAVDSTTKSFTYRRIHTINVGEMVITNRLVAFIVRPQYKELYDKAVYFMKNAKFVSNEVRDEMQKYLPHIFIEFETITGDSVVVINKEFDTFLLKDVVNCSKWTKDPKHVAWIMSTLYNNLCYLQISGLTHNAIALDTYFINPRLHYGMLYGGWWFSVQSGHRHVSLPTESYAILNFEEKRTKIASNKLDLTAARLFGLKLLEGVNPKNIPRPMIEFLIGATSGDAVEDYKNWYETLKRSFGDRRYVDLPIKDSDVYTD